MKFSEFNIATSAGQIDYIVGYSGIQNYRISPSQFIGTYSTLNYIADSGNGTIDLGTQAFSILGTANEIETVGVAQTLTLRFPAAGVILPDGSRATTQPLGDNSTKVATTAYVNASITAEDLDFSGDTGTGSVDLDSQILNIIGTTNEIETAASGQTLTIGLPDDVSITGELTVLGIGQSSFAGQVTIPLNPVATTDAASKGYVDSQITAQDLDFTGDSGTGQVDLDSQALSITGGAVITTTALNQNLDIVHDNVSRTDTTSTDSPAFGGTFTSVDSVSSSSQGHITAINVKTVTLPTPSDATITLDAGTLLNGGGDFTLNQALNETITFNHDSVSRTDTTSTDAPAFGGTFTAVDSVTSSTEGHITGINLKTVTVPTPTTVNDNRITIDAGTNLNGGGDFTLNQNFDETITVNLDTTITGLTSVTSTTFAGQLNGSISSATTATTQAPNDNSTKVATTAYVDSSAGNYLPLAGGTMSGSIAMGGNDISGGGTATFTTFVGALQGNADTASALAASGNITLTGDTTSTGGPYTYTSGGNVAIATTIADTTVTGKVLTGVNLGTAQVIAATDSILDAFGYLQAQITQLPQGLVYQGTWNASTNTPTLTSGSGTTGHFYIVSVAGSTNLDGITDWQVGDWAIFVEAGGTDTWQKIDNTSAITGTGTANKLAKWTGPTTLSTGLVEDDGTTVTIGNSGDLDVTGDTDVTGDLAWGTSLTDTTNTISITKFVDEADGIPANDNDTSIPTSAAVKDYVDTQIGTVDTLADVLAIGNTTGGTDISVSSGDDITFAANSKTIFNSALSIYNTGTQSVIYANTNNLLIESTTYATVQALSDIYLKPNGGNNGITITGGGAVTLYHNNAQKLATTTTGLTVTGRISNLTDPTLAQDAATKNYVDTQLGGQDTLAEILSNGNTTGGTDIAVSAGDDITFTSTSKAMFGASSDLQIYHNGSNSYIDEGGTGGLLLESNSYIYLQTSNGAAYTGKFINGGAVELYHNGTKKFETTSTGIDVTGNGTFTGQVLCNTNTTSPSTGDAAFYKSSSGAVLSGYQAILETGSAGSRATALTIDNSQNATFTGNITLNGNVKKVQWIDTYGNWKIEAGNGSNKLVIHSESLVADYVTIKGGGVVQLNDYGSGSNTGTAAYNLQVDSSGNIIETPGSVIDGSGTTNYVAKWQDPNTITNSIIYDNGTNIGIGTTSPTTAKLVVDADQNTYGLRIDGDTTTGQSYGVRLRAGTNSVDAALRVENTSASTMFLVRGDGQVGIGTDSPDELLHLHNTSQNSYLYMSGGGSLGETYGGFVRGYGVSGQGGHLELGVVDAGTKRIGITIQEQGNQIEFDTAGTERMRIDSSGNVGINETSPSSYFSPDLVVKAKADLGGITIRSNATSHNNYLMFADGTTGDERYRGYVNYNHSVDSMTFGSAAIARMSIDSNGRIYNTESLNNGNTFYGWSAGNVSTTGQFNTSIGYNSGDNITGGSHNTLYGRDTGQAITTGYDNTAIGGQAGKEIVGGHSNTLIGRTSGQAITSGTENTFLGKGTGNVQTTASYNIFIGNNAGQFNTTGSYTVAIGREALRSQTTGGYSTAVGYQALYSTTTSNLNTGVGMQAGFYQTGTQNTFVGAYSGIGASGVSTGNNNTSLGYRALTSLRAGQQNTVLGTAAGYNLTDGSYNTLVGLDSGFNTTTGVSNAAFGRNTLVANTTGSYNTALGSDSLYNSTTASNNTALGYVALYNNTTGTENTALGRSALESSTTGSYNTAVGYQSLYLLGAGGDGNTAMGQQALQNNTASHNTAFGRHALIANTSGSANVAVGAFAGDSNTSGIYNVYIGYDAGQAANNNENVHVGFYAGRLSTGGENTIIGSQAVRVFNSSASNIVAVGRAALYSLTSGSDNTAVGHQSGFNVTTGTENTFLGRSSGDAITTGSFNVAIGSVALSANTTQSHNVAIGRASQQAATGAANVGVGTDTLEVSSGSYNTAVGYRSNIANTTGTRNSTFGALAGIGITTGNYNTILGYNAGSSQTGASYVTAVGDYALANNTASHNTAVGQGASQFETSGEANTAIGTAALQYQVGGNYNVAVGQGASANSSSYNKTGTVHLGRQAGFANTGDYSIGIGYQALYATGTGAHNVGIGFRALHNLSTGARNIAIGYEAGYDISTGVDNVFEGYQAGENVTTGSYNVIIGRGAGRVATSMSYATIIGRTAGTNHTSGAEPFYIGYDAGQQVTSGNHNTAVGTSAMTYGNGSDNTYLGWHAGFGTNGQSCTGNTGIGKQSLRNVTTGSSSVAVGYRALYVLASGTSNTAVGYGAGLNITTGDENTALGTLALSNVTTGSFNLGIGKDAFGEVTVTSYNTGVGNLVGVYQTGNYNTSMGYLSNYGVSGASSGDYNTTMGYYAGYGNRGENNTFIGGLAGRFNSTGTRNTIVGAQAADNATITGSHNTALGFGAAHNISSGVHNVSIGDSSFFAGNANYTIAIGSESLYYATGSSNVAIGYRAGHVVTSGSNNTLIGYESGRSLTTGAPNTAVGTSSLYSATTGFANTVMGYHCGVSLTSGSQNTAMGQYAMRYSTTAGVNVAIGYEAMGIYTSTTAGARNVAVGYQAGAWITTGANNVLLGGNAGGSTSPAGQITTASNRVCLGDNNITHLYCATSTITTSDARDKTDVEDLTLGLDFIKELNPKTYRWDKRDWYEDGTPDGSKKAPKIESGLMAQEVLEAEKKFGYATEDNDMLFVDETEDKTKYGMKYERLVPVLINAIKELEKEIVNLKSQINK